MRLNSILVWLLMTTGGLWAADVEVHVLEQIKDGDTVVVTWSKTTHLTPQKRVVYLESVIVRFEGFDAAETRRIKRKGVRVSEEEVATGKRAKFFLEEMLKGKKILLRTDFKYDVYGRLLGRLIFWDEQNQKYQSVNEIMTANGFSRQRFEKDDN